MRRTTTRTKRNTRTKPPAGVDPEWYARCLFLCRMQAWEAMLAEYLPYWRAHQHDITLFTNGGWKVLFPPAYWRWYNENPGVHPNDHRTRHNKKP